MIYELILRKSYSKEVKGSSLPRFQKEQYDKLIADLSVIDKSGKKTPHEYYLLKKYEVLKCGVVFKLLKRPNANEDPIYFATLGIPSILICVLTL